MSWDAEKIRGLRLRLGWSQSDLARRLQIESQQVGQWEMGLEEIRDDQSQALDHIFNQAELHAEQMSNDSLAEILFDQDEVPQVDDISIRRKFYNNQ